MAGTDERISPTPTAPPVLDCELFGISEELVLHWHGRPSLQPQTHAGEQRHVLRTVKDCFTVGSSNGGSADSRDTETIGGRFWRNCQAMSIGSGVGAVVAAARKSQFIEASCLNVFCCPLDVVDLIMR